MISTDLSDIIAALRVRLANCIQNAPIQMAEGRFQDAHVTETNANAIQAALWNLTH